MDPRTLTAIIHPVEDDPAVIVMWEDYVAASGVDGGYTAWPFGSPSEPDLADELAELVLNGPKRATAGLLAEYEDEDEPLPQVGDHSVILDGRGLPVCIVRTTWLETRPMRDVDEQFAWDEGEGDRTLQWWKEAHIRFFARQGYEVTEDTMMVLERFELVWPV